MAERRQLGSKGPAQLCRLWGRCNKSYQPLFDPLTTGLCAVWMSR